MHNQSWMISLGQTPPPPDPRRLESPPVNFGDTRSVRSEQDKCRDFFKSRVVTKFRRGLICCVKAGVNNNSEIYRILTERGFAIKHNSKEFYSLSAFRQYVMYVRRKYGIFGKEKQDLILELLKQGKTCQYICDNIKTSRKYILEVAGNHDIDVKRIKPKYNPPSWSKELLKKLNLPIHNKE